MNAVRNMDAKVLSYKKEERVGDEEEWRVEILPPVSNSAISVEPNMSRS